MAVSVIIPVRDEAGVLARCAERMLAQDYEGTMEFLFVDGGSTDGTRSVLDSLAAEDSRVQVLTNPARLVPNALNVGLAATRGEFVARMDAHTVYPLGYLRAGVERLQRADDVVSVSGPQLARGTSPGSRRVALALSTPLGVGGADFRCPVDEEIEVDSGFTGMWRRDVLVGAGGWDERSPYDEDVELAARLRGAGGRYVCLPDMAAYYIPRESLRALARQYWHYGEHKVRTFKEHPSAMRPSHLLPPVVAATLAAAVTPKPLCRAARLGIAVYSAGLVAGAAAAKGQGPLTDVARLPTVLATMHLAYGFGLFAGVLRAGFPAAAVIGAVRRGVG